MLAAPVALQTTCGPHHFQRTATDYRLLFIERVASLKALLADGATLLDLLLNRGHNLRQRFMALAAVLARAESDAFADRLELISASPVLQAWCSLDVIVGQVFSDIGHKVSNSLRGQRSRTLR